MRLVKQPLDDDEFVHAQDVVVHDVHDLTVETNATHVVDEVAYEVVQLDAPVVDDVVQPDVVVVDEVAATYLIPSATNGAFPEGPIDRSVLT